MSADQEKCDVCSGLRTLSRSAQESETKGTDGMALGFHSYVTTHLEGPPRGPGPARRHPIGTTQSSYPLTAATGGRTCPREGAGRRSLGASPSRVERDWTGCVADR